MNAGLIEKFLGRIVRRGTLELRYPDGGTSTLGKPLPGWPDVTVRFTDKAAMRRILRHEPAQIGAPRDLVPGEWVDVERVGWAPPGAEAPVQFDLPVGRDLRLLGRGTALFAEEAVLFAEVDAARVADVRAQLWFEAATHRLARDIALAAPLRARDRGEPLLQFLVQPDAEHAASV